MAALTWRPVLHRKRRATRRSAPARRSPCGRMACGCCLGDIAAALHPAPAREQKRWPPLDEAHLARQVTRAAATFGSRFLVANRDFAAIAD